MDGVTSRLYSGDHDRRLLRDFIIATYGAPSSSWHVGDLWWGLYQNTLFDPRRNIRLWEGDDGALVGFAWFHPPAAVEWQIHPQLRGSDALAGEMLAWALEHRRTFAQDGDDAPALTCSAGDGDTPRIAFLERHGFERGDHYLALLRRALDGPIPEPLAPAGITLRAVAGENELEQRVALHREVWHPSRVTLEAYRRLRAAPGYTPDLDIVAATADGTLASYCICWLDTVNKVGEFEPVGTHPAFRRRGIGKAVILEGLRRLQAHGMTAAVVASYGDNAASMALYQAAGFRVHSKEYDYSKKL